jgi:5-methylcytosine-specific restriction endonuclease McrA
MTSTARWNSTLPAPTAPLKRSALRRQSPRHRAGQRQWSRVTAQRIAACGGRCQVAGPGCEGAAREGHHILARSQGGKHEAGNCLPVCGVCHKRIHQRPAWAKANGWILCH